MTTYHRATPDAGAAFAFLTDLYANTMEPGWLNLFHVDKASGQRMNAWAELSDLSPLLLPITEWGARGDMYLGAAPRRENLGPYRRGGVADCLSIPGLWLDIDVASDVHRLPDLPTSYHEASELARKFPLKPSAVVWSGYGLQVWWRLSEALEANDAAILLPRWEYTWQRLAEEMGVHLDNVSNIDRLMRLPGTFNFKGSVPVPVTMRRDARTYDASDVAEFLEDLPVREEKHRTNTQHLAGHRFSEFVTCQQILTEHDCQMVRRDANGDEHWHYAASVNEQSCTVYAEDGHCTIWSETMAETFGLELRRPYDPFGLWAHLAHGGDFALAHAALLANGIPDLGAMEATAPELVQVVFESASMATPTEIEWLWYGWLPRGKLIVLDGDPDSGKSTVMLDLAARLTKGQPMPDGTAGVAPTSVLLMAGEDDLNDTISWRLMAAGADMRRVHVHKGTYGPKGEIPLMLPLHLEPIRQAIVQYQAALVIVDVFDEYVDDKVDTYKNSSVRKALAPIRQAAAETGATFVILRHLRKEGNAKAIYRGGGSIGIVGAARGGWVIGYLPEDESVRVLATSKMNIAPKPKPLAFKLLPHETYPCAYVDWRGALEDMTADLLLDPHSGKDAAERDERVHALAQCKEAMMRLLRDGDMWSNELWDALKEFGVSKRTYDRARADLTESWPERRPDGVRGWRVRLKDETTDGG